jgi:hypothetical protein
MTVVVKTPKKTGARVRQKIQKILGGGGLPKFFFFFFFFFFLRGIAVTACLVMNKKIHQVSSRGGGRAPPDPTIRDRHNAFLEDIFYRNPRLK